MLFIFLIFAGLIWYVSHRLRSTFEKYKEIQLSSRMSGRQVAENMLRFYGIADVKVLSVEGQLTDHYNPLHKTVNLSHDVYYGQHAAAVAVAAHEVGHAVQHATGYAWLRMRSLMVPAVQYGSVAFPFLLMGGMLLLAVAQGLGLVAIGIAITIQAVLTLFSIITLPVEYDASHRALRYLENSGTVTAAEHDMAADALKWAARTYLIAALQAVVTLLYYIWAFFGRRSG